MSHHQYYFSIEMLNQGVEYYFIASENVAKERLQGGWHDMNKKAEWIIRQYEGGEQHSKAKKLIAEADLIIAGSYPFRYLRARILKNKPVFLYSERWFKTDSIDNSEYVNFKGFLSNLVHRKYFNFFKVYMLAASAYTAYDCSVYNNFIGKCYKWGYFPCFKRYNLPELLKEKKKNNKLKILWAARFLDWKCPEDAVTLANKLNNLNYDFELEMLGDGPEYEKIRTYIEQSGLIGKVKLSGVVSPEIVRKKMEESNIFIFTSNYREGWGAVLNEAMNSACAVVASHAIGSVPFLINDKSNGFIYTFENKDELCDIIKYLFENPLKIEEVGIEAYHTIEKEWNPEMAAKRIIMLYNKLIKGQDIEIPLGICSKAEIIKNDWRVSVKNAVNEK